ncbi:cobalt-precorrin-5B (C(1))-methyltransferase [Cochlodiniinecator piscidefendens]|uniref:cobalt-precorrin-5B (C(1))-methyltransferase n=1 Tax=Cochlodiniinecator piscidefendens TaxID=2715756 RepID=UPI0014077D38|nr:cobalt-precorrin-5B (C(1))-methyltransferase [Cochlodiniinecator piscidefendens]
MEKKPISELRRGWTTGACATAATKAALKALWGEGFADKVRLTLPRGERPEFDVVETAMGDGWAEAGIVKDAGDDPDVTHQALIKARVRVVPGGVTFKAGQGVGMVTRPGLPIAVGEPAINPVPRQMMTQVVEEVAARLGHAPNVEITVIIPKGEELALKTWNPRLGILGGLSVLGTTGVVRPFSCAAWIASIHRGVDVARAEGMGHVSGCTGATSEKVVQSLYGLPDHAMLDMGDFSGGLLKYLRKHPVPHVTIGGGIGKLTKLAQGAVDLHSGRSQVDFSVLSEWSEAAGLPVVRDANTALQAYEIAGKPLAEIIARRAHQRVLDQLKEAPVSADVVIIDRKGTILARAGDTPT